MARLYVIRHGQTPWNAQNRVCGRADVPLDDTGIAQARAAAEQLRGLHLDRVIASPLTRARQTASLLLDTAGIGLPIELDARIAEQDFGAFDGTSRTEPTFRAQRRQAPLRQGGGESAFDVVHRVYSLLDELRDAQQDVLLVCHGAVSRAIRSYFVSMTGDEFFDYLADNCELVAYDL